MIGIDDSWFQKKMDQNNFLDFEKEKTNHLTSVPGSH